MATQKKNSDQPEPWLVQHREGRAQAKALQHEVSERFRPRDPDTGELLTISREDWFALESSGPPRTKRAQRATDCRWDPLVQDNPPDSHWEENWALRLRDFPDLFTMPDLLEIDVMRFDIWEYNTVRQLQMQFYHSKGNIYGDEGKEMYARFPNFAAYFYHFNTGRYYLPTGHKTVNGHIRALELTPDRILELFMDRVEEKTDDTSSSPHPHWIWTGALISGDTPRFSQAKYSSSAQGYARPYIYQSTFHQPVPEGRRIKMEPACPKLCVQPHHMLPKPKLEDDDWDDEEGETFA